LGELFGELAADVSSLMRQEIQLAQAEIKAEAAKAAKGAGLLGAAGFAGYMVLLLGSLTIAYALSGPLGLGWATFFVTALWAVAGAVMAVVGRRRLQTVSPTPQRTVQTLKEDVQWAKHPTS
jgi:hypothetical protein